jgi:hypothetical protein
VIRSVHVIVAWLRMVDPLLERTVRLPSLFGKRQKEGRRAIHSARRATCVLVDRELTEPVPAALPMAPGAGAALLRVVGPNGPLDVWLGGEGDHSALEADVRAVGALGSKGLPALAVALGDVAARHKLEVRVIPRMDARGSSILVLFGSRTHRSK